MATKIKTSFTLSPETIEKLDSLAKQDSRSRASMLERLVQKEYELMMAQKPQ